jgi:hypothetical protein
MIADMIQAGLGISGFNKKSKSPAIAQLRHTCVQRSWGDGVVIGAQFRRPDEMQSSMRRVSRSASPSQRAAPSTNKMNPAIRILTSRRSFAVSGLLS